MKHEAAEPCYLAKKIGAEHTVDDYGLLFFYQAAEFLLATNSSVVMGDLEYVMYSTSPRFLF